MSAFYEGEVCITFVSYFSITTFHRILLMHLVGFEPTNPKGYWVTASWHFPMCYRCRMGMGFCFPPSVASGVLSTPRFNPAPIAALGLEPSSLGIWVEGDLLIYCIISEWQDLNLHILVPKTRGLPLHPVIFFPFSLVCISNSQRLDCSRLCGFHNMKEY